ncbi:MAG: hypothetical protein QOG15_1695 [Solirubrobacteraceae bacterium]|jgi:hypothetical protein|nr:hypothetical protein [Solirubrobacteraceae bacterium]
MTDGDDILDALLAIEALEDLVNGSMPVALSHSVQVDQAKYLALVQRIRTGVRSVLDTERGREDAPVTGRLDELERLAGIPVPDDADAKQTVNPRDVHVILGHLRLPLSDAGIDQFAAERAHQTARTLDIDVADADIPDLAELARRVAQDGARFRVSNAGMPVAFLGKPPPGVA